ncbi:hypothetical protein PX554_13805 [Sphingomonas sp. H39-1-10]|uniref:hypothetical protein n=1 Tax=Sphingomonas pollutisoli TaxID=3030829 RepID=UPI0023B97FDA|nr:hypothetical protein [Sphingomonas pollutisoli]MDF0489211.1 hypothetical protein [Sphingomonas pollutisoli]
MLIAFPAAPVPQKIKWEIEQPGQVNRGEFTGRRRVTLLSAAPRMHATVTMPPILGEDRVLDWRAFVFECDGVANKFRLIACERDQVAEAAVVVDGAGQFGQTLKTRGWSTPGLRLKRGHFITVGEQLLVVRAPVIVDGSGRATISVKPHIRVQPGDGDAIEVRRPYAVMSMSDPKAGWEAGVGQNYAVTFDCEEAF